ncbi:MAG: hypothetical protein J7L47_05215 [Candidatus Odinarchaeota archaeon]|nr:hypothetical protein [Candidatus Odinarchaeota archaeon]
MTNPKNINIYKGQIEKIFVNASYTELPLGKGHLGVRKFAFVPLIDYMQELY